MRCELNGEATGNYRSFTKCIGWEQIFHTLRGNKYTGDERFLQVAKGVADYVIIPPVDYMQPAEPIMWDASAGAITASGYADYYLIEALMKCVGAWADGGFKAALYDYL